MLCLRSGFWIEDDILDSLGYDIWTKYPESVIVRHHRFLRSTGLFVDQNFDVSGEWCWFSGDRIGGDNEWILKDGLNSSSESSICAKLCSMSPRSIGANNLDGDDVVEYVLDELVHDRKLSQPMITAVDKSQPASIEEFRRISGTFLLNRPLSNGHKGSLLENGQNLKRKFGALTCIGSSYYESHVECKNDLELIAGKKMPKVHTHSLGKKYKELSSLYVGQDFLSHEGAILSLKFSIDGQYLASAGEDAIVRVWNVTEEDRPDKINISNKDSCTYFAFRESSHFTSLDVDKEYMHLPKANKRSMGSSCAILPLKVFQIAEKPYHEFHGHLHEVLDLSWSSKEYLLSSSIDKTVRLWKVGNDQCLRVFSHNDYVTSVSFNPVNDNYFISGSIDGKVRIWEMFGGKVADYTDIREIVSSACFQPDGKGVIVRTMTGQLLFFSDER